jgi:hypothetical protein
MRKSMTDEEFYASFKPATIRQPSFAVGTKVFIVGKDHPARGETGVVTRAPFVADGIIKGVWCEVEIDGWAGHQCGVQPGEMRELKA